MLNTRDLNYKVGKAAMERNYYLCTAKEKKIIIDEELIKYAIFKAKEIDYNFECDEKEVTLPSLIEYIVNSNIENKDSFVESFVHYIRQIISELQNFAFLWYIEDEQKYIEKPMIEVDANRVVTKMITHMETDKLKIFNHLYYYYVNEFLVDEKEYVIE